MLLNDSWLRRPLRRDENGIALVTVLGVMAVTVIVAIAIATAAIGSAAFSSATRASVQARAAADAGIDLAWASMRQGTFYCQVPTVSGGLDYTTTVDYFDETGAAIACSGTSTLSGLPAKAVVNSSGSAANSGIAGNASGDERTVIAIFDVEVNPGSVNLDKAVFSDGTYTMTNNNTFIDATGLSQAHLYSNGDIACKTQVALQGWIMAQGNVTTPNQCLVAGSVWTGGSFTANAQTRVSGDVFSRGGATTPATGVSLDSSWVGGTVVANGPVTLGTSSNSNYCPLHGYNGKVCGSIISLESTITLSNAPRIGGGLLAKGNINIGSTNNNLIVGGNVISTTGGLSGSNFGNSGNRVGGYVAVGGSSALPLARIGNKPSSCAVGSGFSACNPTQPPLPLAEIPAVLGFPGNQRVVAPPRESLPRVDSDAAALAKWSGWNIETVACSAVKTRVAAGWTGKLLLNVTGCTSALTWTNNEQMTLTGDLVLLNQSGFDLSNNVVFKSNNLSIKREIMLIVPSDAKTTAGTPLVTWTTPIPSDPTFTRPTCAGGNYGDIRANNLDLKSLKTFLYTPCDLVLDNGITGFEGQMYSGTSNFPNNSTMVFTKLEVPGATSSSSTAPFVNAEQTARFDARE